MMIYNVPFNNENEEARCDFCMYNENPCTFFNADGSDAVAMNDCDGNLCSKWDKCEAVWKEIELYGALS